MYTSKDLKRNWAIPDRGIIRHIHKQPFDYLFTIAGSLHPTSIFGAITTSTSEVSAEDRRGGKIYPPLHINNKKKNIYCLKDSPCTVQIILKKIISKCFPCCLGKSQKTWYQNMEFAFCNPLVIWTMLWTTDRTSGQVIGSGHKAFWLNRIPPVSHNAVLTLLFKKLSELTSFPLVSKWIPAAWNLAFGRMDQNPVNFILFQETTAPQLLVVDRLGIHCKFVCYLFDFYVLKSLFLWHFRFLHLPAVSWWVEQLISYRSSMLLSHRCQLAKILYTFNCCFKHFRCNWTPHSNKRTPWVQLALASLCI